MTAANLLIGAPGARPDDPRTVDAALGQAEPGIMLFLAVLGLIETVQYFDGRHPDAVIIAEIAVSLVLAAVLGWPCLGAARPGPRAAAAIPAHAGPTSFA